jgi:hypothetical protein
MTVEVGSLGRVSQSLTVIAATAAGVPAAAEVITLLKALVGAQETQTKLLRTLAREIYLERTGPGRSALEHLQAAVRKAADSDEVARHLVAAENLYIEALGKCASARERSVVQFNLGVVSAARGDRAEALYRLRSSHDACKEWLDVLEAPVGVVHKLKSVRVISSLGLVIGLPLAAYMAFLLHKANAMARITVPALEAFVPFVNEVAQSYNALAPAPELLGVRQTGTVDAGDWQVTWTSPPVPIR